jgi:hypothetical protein
VPGPHGEQVIWHTVVGEVREARRPSIGQTDPATASRSSRVCSLVAADGLAGGPVAGGQNERPGRTKMRWAAETAIPGRGGSPASADRCGCCPGAARSSWLCRRPAGP